MAEGVTKTKSNQQEVQTIYHISPMEDNEEMATSPHIQVYIDVFENYFFRILSLPLCRM